jgi:S-adenosylmethionine/arginine decarboxylase-like enzyme
MHPVGEVVIQPYAHWPDGAPSGVLFIEESALIVHCYPEKDYIELILHSCKAIPNRVDVAIGIIKDLKLTLKYHRYESAMDWRVLANGAAYQALLWPDAIRMASYHGAG